VVRDQALEEFADRMERRGFRLGAREFVVADGAGAVGSTMFGSVAADAF
jgi:hypothetical protein